MPGVQEIPVIPAGRETNSLTAVITNDTWVEAKKTEGSTENRITHIEKYRLGTESDKSSKDEEFIIKMIDKIRIHKIKTIKQKYYNTIEIRIEDIDVYCEPDSGASANILDEYQFNALKRRVWVMVIFRWMFYSHL